MMSKKVLFAALVAALSFTTVSMAAEPVISGNVSLDSRYDYRGVKYSDDASLGLNLKADNLLIDGLYVSGTFNKVGDTAPFNAQSQIRSDLSVGYGFDITDKSSIDVSVAHVYNAPEFTHLHGNDVRNNGYSEFRVKGTYDVLFAEVGQAFGPWRSTYAKVGVSVPVTNSFNVGGAVSGVYYKGDHSSHYNNTEVFAKYNVTKSFDVYGKYSFGGKDMWNHSIGNYGTVGVSYNF